jgi:hypothetical protein
MRNKDDFLAYIVSSMLLPLEPREVCVPNPIRRAK